MIKSLFISAALFTSVIYGQPYPDQQYVHEKADLVQMVESLNNIEVSIDGTSFLLTEGANSGGIIFKPDSSEYPFNRGLPSWNGHAYDSYSSFKVFMRFYNSGWSPWLTVGYWKDNIWPSSSYGIISYSGGEIEVDYAVLNSYHSKWQFKVEMKRLDNSTPSPVLSRLCFFVSDQETTDEVNIPSILEDKPDSIYIDTDHIWQTSLDPVIGSEICSPSSVSMVLRSYNIEVDPLQFARDTYCKYWEMFGIWPRVVQHAAEYGLSGSVTRYRSWSQAREILADGGRVVISVGSPLYPNGHLIMLAGFDSKGNPVVHDPAISNGYKYKWDKKQLSESWFKKGGIAYTFFPGDTSGTTSVFMNETSVPKNSSLLYNYPNPFNPGTTIKFTTSVPAFITLNIYDILGRKVSTPIIAHKDTGEHEIYFDASELPAGTYFYNLFIESSSGVEQISRKMIYLK